MSNKYIHTILAVSLIFIGAALCSCSIKKRIQKADKRFEIGEYYVAGEMYKNCYKKVPANDKKTRAYVAFRQGEAYRLINNQRSVNAYKNAIRNKYSDSIVYLRNAQALQYQGKYSEAQKNYEIYLEAHADDYVAQGGLYACKMMNDWKKESSRYKIGLAQDFNQKRYSQFAPAFIGDNDDALMFTSNATSASKKMKNNSSITGVPICALYSTRKNQLGKWEDIEKIEELSGGANAEGDDSAESETSSKQDKIAAEVGVCSFTADGKTMYFTYSKPVNGVDVGAKIYVSHRASGAWGEPQEVKLFADSTITCGHPSVTANGDTLYFVSDAPNGYGGKDIYLAENADGSWVGVKNLGPLINTSDDELYPTILKNGTLYFSSNGHPGYGGLDIFRAIPNDTTWLLQNMGAPFNSSADDFGITFAKQRQEGYFSSNRNQRKGNDMIYWFNLPEMVMLVEGKVQDNNGENLTIATIRLVGNDGTNQKVQVKRDGTYKLKLQKDVEYVMLATSRGYLNQKQQLSTINLKDSKVFQQDFMLTPVSKPITMDNIFYEFGKWELTAASETGLNDLVKLLQDNPNITIELSAHTDRVGNATANKTLSEKRAQAVVNYLIAHGIESDRLTPVGYGKDRPVVADKNIHSRYSFIPIDQVLDEQFIDTLTKEQQEICNQINRRTEFKVLKTTYKLY